MSIDVGLGDVLRVIADLAKQYRDRLEATRDKKKDQLLSAAELLESMSALHVKAIVFVCKPLLENRDILATTRAYYELVDNPDFPIGYGLAKGVLEAAYGMKEFKRVHEALGAILGQVHSFQTACFMLHLGSGVAADSLNDAAELYTLSSVAEKGKTDPRADHDRIASLQRKVGMEFDTMFGWLAQQRKTVHAEPPPSISGSDDVVRVSQEWARQWKSYVQETLYGKRGLHYYIGQLRMSIAG
jgi:hypothetical protein